MCIEGGQCVACATFVLRKCLWVNSLAANTFALSVTLFLILAAQAAEAFIANFYGRNGGAHENAQGS
jgi:hypothetical protein